MIPKTIHYCWFGGSEIPEILNMYMNSWKKLKNNGYKLVLHNEEDCSFNENEFIRKAYKEKKWSFISDYYRLKFLYEEGGIYLDTDIYVIKPFDSLLNCKAFIGYMYDSQLETAVIGAEKGSVYIKRLLDMYENSDFPSFDYLVNNKKENIYSECFKVPNNEAVTWKTIECYPQITLDNKYQEMGDVTIFPISAFDSGKVFGEGYCIHMYTNLWNRDISVKKKLREYIKIHIPVRKIMTIVRYANGKKINKKSNFYKYKQMRKNNIV